MVKGSGVAANIRVSEVPVLPGVRDLLGQGAVPGGTFRNLSSVAGSTDWDEALTEEDRLLLCDAQTSGGLLISVPRERRDELISELKSAGVPTTAIVGEITDGPPGRVHVSA